MKNLDFELGRRLHGFVDSIAADTGSNSDTVYSRLTELLSENNSNSIANSNSISIGKRKSPVFVVGSKVHPMYREIVSLRKQGLSAMQVAEKVGLHRSKVYSILAQAKLNQASNQHVSRSSVVDRIRQLAKAGRTAPEISAKVGVSADGVRYHCRKHGIRLKKSSTSNNVFWERLTPEQRSTEMKRRRAVAAAKRAGQANLAKEMSQ